MGNWNYLKIYGENGEIAGYVGFEKGSESEEKTIDYLLDNEFKFEKITEEEYNKNTDTNKIQKFNIDDDD
jgi:hypothetical protein